MLIDSHHHLWKYSVDDYGWIDDSMSVLKNDFLAPQLAQIADDHSVDGFVSVQARQCIEETDALLEIAEQESRIRGIVGWVPLVDPDVDKHLHRYADQPRVVGFRHVVQDEPDNRFLLREDFNRGVGRLREFGFVYDILIFGRQLPAALEFVDRHPDQKFVLDHIAKPAIDGDHVNANWMTNFRQLAKRSNVVCKFSGVVTEVRDEQWTIDTIRPYFDIALEAFGADRLMFGSDWPVCLLRSQYTRWLDTVRQLTEPLSDSEKAQFFAQTAIDAYGLK
ncbi:amidohydrolase family protein [Crateriforma conspicua]|uniref:amidohydrolase family protein n=1 Tax=Crateriforma conspicua TaxID=2527996 RepID=UPI00118C9017|nr:amidohydrolase family protein [Crateriforma conspicua]QDV65871.1 Amidohydrolase [Crateriforma conspicua]